MYRFQTGKHESIFVVIKLRTEFSLRHFCEINVTSQGQRSCHDLSYYKHVKYVVLDLAGLILDAKETQKVVQVKYNYFHAFPSTSTCTYYICKYFSRGANMNAYSIIELVCVRCECNGCLLMRCGCACTLPHTNRQM